MICTDLSDGEDSRLFAQAAQKNTVGSTRTCRKESTRIVGVGQHSYELSEESGWVTVQYRLRYCNDPSYSYRYRTVPAFDSSTTEKVSERT